jgi:hypothetical protein
VGSAQSYLRHIDHISGNRLNQKETYVISNNSVGNVNNISRIVYIYREYISRCSSFRRADSGHAPDTNGSAYSRDCFFEEKRKE